MTRPSINNFGRTRAAAARASEDDDTSLSSAMTFRRRFPKIGTAFQAKVPKTITDHPYISQRPLPEPISLDAPFMTQSDYESLQERLKSSECLSMDNEPASSPSSNMVKTTKTARSTNVRTLYGSRQVQPIVQAFHNTTITSNSTSELEDDEQHRQWTNALVTWFDEHEKAQIEASASRGRKSRFKRPRDLPLPDLPLPPPRKLRALSEFREESSTAGSISSVPPEQTQWRLLVDLSAGQASKRIRERKRKLRSEKSLLKVDVAKTGGDVWRNLCREERINTTTVGVRGDFRIESEQKPCSGLQSSVDGPGSLPQHTLRAVLACATSYREQISDGPPIPASVLLRFCQQADKLIPYRLTSSSIIGDEINTAMDSLALDVLRARKLRAHWMDLWFQEGVELDTIRKSLATAGSINLQPDELVELNRQLVVVTAWQRRLDDVRNSPRSGRSDIKDLEALRDEAQSTHAFRSKGLLNLEARLEKAHQLSDKIFDWKGRISQNAEPRENLKFLGALVREINRLKIHFPAAQFALDLSQTTDAWVDRANIAIRSRISLKEIKCLISRGQELPVELSDYLDKLQSRKALAEDWSTRLMEHVSLPDETAGGSLLAWMKTVRSKLDEGGWVLSSIHDLACEGSRIPVEMDCVKLLQVELDARNWSVKARKWLPDASNSDGMRKGKLEDMREHLEKATLLRQRLVLPSNEKPEWKLDCEEELLSILNEADHWLGTFKEVIEGGCRRSGDGKAVVSIDKLREIVSKGNNIHANLGPPWAKTCKILTQAEAWHATHHTLVALSTPGQEGENVTLDNIREAVEDAKNIVVLELKEAHDLHSVVVRIEEWLERANVAIGGKKLRGKSKLVFGIADVQQLIEDGKGFPISTNSEISQLENLVGAVINWQSFAKRNIQKIADSFLLVKKAIDEKYGPPDSFSPGIEGEQEAPKPRDEADKDPASPSVGEGQGTPPPTTDLVLGSECEELIKIISQDAKNSCIVTPEAEVAQHLEDVARWTARSLKYIDNRREIFDSRFFGAFDRFRKEGGTLLGLTSVREDCPEFQQAHSWRTLMTDQLKRMEVLLAEREAFADWCKRAEEFMAGGDKKVTIEKLRELAKAGSIFPSDHDTVSGISDLVGRCDAFIAKVKAALESKEKMSMNEAKATLEEGNRLKVMSNELRALRNGVKEARGWQNKVKRLKPEHGQAQFKLVRALLDSYDELIVNLPEEHKQLSHAVKNYCLCRRPFEGFMVKCEKCSDWFHGACVGISQARAERKPIDNYVCVRCLVKKVFDQSSTSVANILRKWTSEADLKKARLVDFQRHQRKTRRETKELEKLKAEAQKLTEEVARLKAPPPMNPSAPPINTQINQTAPGVNQMNSASSVSDPSLTIQAEPNSLLPSQTDQTARITPVEAMEEPEPSGEEKRNSQEELVRSIEKVTAAIKLCQSRLQDLHEAAVLQKNEEEVENLKADALKRWCVRVRSFILAPSSEGQAIISCPPTNGTMSPPMISLVQEAEKYGLLRYKDVKTVFNAFKCICWSSQAMETLSRQPSATDAVALVRNAAKINLPDEKGLRMLKSMTARATTWNFKASRILTPVPGQKNPFDLKDLKNLASLADDIPFRMIMEQRVSSVIEDNGTRHCVCGGPSDGRMMLCCDKCDIWFHSHCVGLSDEEANSVEEWICPPCNGTVVDVSPDKIKGFHDAFGKIEDEAASTSSDDDDVSPKAPTAKALWPPFGLVGSAKSIESLGQNLCSLPDDVGPWDGKAQSATSAVTDKQQHCTTIGKDNKKPPPQPPRLLNLPASVVSVGGHFPAGSMAALMSVPSTKMPAKTDVSAFMHQNLRPSPGSAATVGQKEANSSEDPGSVEHMRDSVGPLLAMRDVMVSAGTLSRAKCD